MVKVFTAQMQIGSSILSEHKLASLVPSRSKRKNHNSTGINLLAVPRYSDLLEDMDAEESDRGRALVTMEASWRTEMAKWIWRRPVARVPASRGTAAVQGTAR